MSLAIVDATYRLTDDAADGITPSRYTLPIGNVPLISQVVGDLAAAGVTRAWIVAAHNEADGLAQALGTWGDPGLSVEIVEAPDGRPHGGVLAALETALGDEPVVLQPGDGLWPGLLSTMRERYGSGDVDLVLSTPGSATAAIDAAPGRLVESALVLGPSTRPLIAQMLDPAAEQRDLTDVLLHGDLRLAICEGDEESWRYANSTAALLEGNRRVLDRLPAASVPPELAASNELRGRVRVAQGVRASGCVIQGPVAIGEGAVLEDSYIGPFTAIGPATALSGAEVDDTIVLERAEIRHPGHRITASIIGEGACVERSFELPRGVAVRLGAHSRLRFS